MHVAGGCGCGGCAACRHEAGKGVPRGVCEVVRVGAGVGAPAEGGGARAIGANDCVGLSVWSCGAPAAVWCSRLQRPGPGYAAAKAASAAVLQVQLLPLLLDAPSEPLRLCCCSGAWQQLLLPLSPCCCCCCCCCRSDAAIASSRSSKRPASARSRFSSSCRQPSRAPSQQASRTATQGS